MHSIIAFVFGVIDLIAGLVILLYGKLSKEAKWIFFLFAFSLAIWSFGISGLYWALNESLANIFIKIIYAGLILFPIFYLHFSLAITRVSERFKRLLPLAYITGIIIAIPLLFIDINGSLVDLRYIEGYKQFFPATSKLYYIFFSILMFMGILILVTEYYISKSPLQKTWTKYIILGALVALPGGIADFFPNFGYALYHHIGHISSSIGMLIVACYTIFRERPEELRVKRGLIYSFLISIITLGLFLIFNKIYPYTPEYLQFKGLFPVVLTTFIIISIFPLDAIHIIISICFLLPFLVFREYTIAIISGIIIVAFHHILRKNVEGQLINLFFKIKHLENIENMLGKEAILSFGELIEKIFRVSKDIEKDIDKIFIVVLENMEYRVLSPTLGMDNKIGYKIKSDKPIINWLKEKKSPLIKEEIENEPFSKKKEGIIETLKEMEAEILFPILYEDGLSGILCLGEERIPSGWINKLKFISRHKDRTNLLSFLSKEILPIHFKNITTIGLEKKIKEFELLQRVISLIQERDDLDEIFYIILTAITHGEGLGFSRAILLLKDEGGTLNGKIAIGPVNDSEALQIWNEIIEQELTLDKCIKRYAMEKNQIYEAEINRRVREIKIPLDEENIFKKILSEKRIELFNEEHHDYSKVREDVKGLLNDIDLDIFAIIPLMIRDKAMGLLIVDRKYDRRAITDYDMDRLNVFTNQVYIPIQNKIFSNQLKENIAILEMLNKVTMDWANIYELEPFLNSVVKSISKGLRCYCAIYLPDNSGKKVLHKAAYEDEELGLDRIEYIGPEKQEKNRVFASPITVRDGIIKVQRSLKEDIFTENEKNLFKMLIDWIDISLGNIFFFEKNIGDAKGKPREIALQDRLAIWQDAVSKMRHIIGNKIHIMETLYSGIKKDIKETDMGKIGNVIEDTKRILGDIKKFASPIELEIEPVDINSFLKSVVVAKEGIGLEFNLDKRIPSINADIGKLRDVFTELVENANYSISLKKFIAKNRESGVEYERLVGLIMEEFGVGEPLNTYLAEKWLKCLEKERITIKTEFIPSERSNLYNLKSKDYIKIDFTDTGCGIYPDFKPRIFEPLFSTRKRGTGLGLSIIENYIALHRGRIEENGVFGEGASFAIFLPIK